MNSREAAGHRVAVISRQLYRAVLSLVGSLSPEMFSQLESSTLSIGSNWCEAHGRESPKMRAQFLRFARGSAYEAAFQFWCADETALSELAHQACEELDAVLVPEAEIPVDVEAALDRAEAETSLT